MRSVSVVCFEGVAISTQDICAIVTSLSKRYDDMIVDLNVAVNAVDDKTYRIAAEGIYDPAYSLSTHATVSSEGSITDETLKWQ